MARVPKWGNFDDQVPYTVYFDKARREKVGNRVPNPNPPLSEQPPPADLPPSHFPNDPAKNPGLVAPPPVPRRNPNCSRLNSGDPVSRAQRGNGELDWAPGQAPTDVPPLKLPNDPPMNPGLIAPPPAARRREDRVPRKSGGPDWAPERTPPHPLHKGAALDSRVSTQGVPPYVSPAQPRARSSVHDANNNFGVGTAVPKFGDWDSNPAAADGYTGTFGRIRDEMQGKATLPPIIRTEPSPYREYEQPPTTGCSPKLCSIL